MIDWIEVEVEAAAAGVAMTGMSMPGVPPLDVPATRRRRRTSHTVNPTAAAITKTAPATAQAIMIVSVVDGSLDKDPPAVERVTDRSTVTVEKTRVAGSEEPTSDIVPADVISN